MKILAHRGYHAHHRENTLEAFQAALDLGVDGIETDVWLTADNIPAIYHDRFTPDGNEVAKLTHAQLCASARFKVPTLDEALSLSSQILWNIELKSSAAAPAVAEAVRQRSKNQFLLTSFHHPVLFQLSAETHCDCGFLIAHHPVILGAFGLPEKIANPLLNTIVWEINHVDEQLIADTQKAGFHNIAFGLGSVDDNNRAKQWNLDAVITDHPENLLSARA